MAGMAFVLDSVDLSDPRLAAEWGMPAITEKHLLEIMVGQLFGITVLLAELVEIAENQQQSSSATSVRFAQFSAQGEVMQLTVDSSTFTNTLVFADDKGDAVAAPEGSTAAYSSDNESVATVVADGTNPLQVDGAVVGVEGSADITGTVTNADGSVFGTATFTVTVGPGAAVSVAWADS